MPSKLNELMLAEMSGQLEDVSHGIFVSFSGLTAQEAHDLRGRLLKNALRLQVVKNRIVTLALKPNLGEEIGGVVDGPTAMVFGNDDPVLAAKEVVECLKEIKSLKLRGGFMEGKTLVADEVEALSKMPSKKDLLAEILGAINSPASNIAYCLDSIFRELNFGAIAMELGGLFDAYHHKKKDEG